MAQIDAGIYNALMQQPRSALDYAEQYAQLDDRKAQRAMNALKMQSLQQDMADQQGYRNALSMAPSDQEGRLSYLIGSSNPLAIKHGQEMQKAALDAQKTGAEIRDKNASAGKSEWEVKLARTQQHIGQLASVSDVDGAMRWLDEAQASGELPADRVAVAKQNLQANPGGLGQWKQQAMLGGMKVAEQLTFKAPKPTELKLGDRVVMVDMNPNSDTYKQEISSAKIGQSPDSIASNATTQRGQNMTDARAREANTLTKEAQRTQIITDPNMGVLAVDKGTGTYKPVMGANGPVPGENKVAASKLNQQLKAGIDMARELLPKATASGIGTVIDAAGNLVGMSSDSNDAAGQLDTLAGWMTTNVPRMQGPQSDKDVLLYRQMAGQVGDRTKPVSIRLKALDTLEQLQSKYSDINGMPSQLPKSKSTKAVVRTGTHNGRRVVQYSDGTTDYAD